MGTEVTPAKNNLFNEETDFKSAISEQLLTKIAGSINFINDKQACVYDFKFLGGFRALQGGEDGAHIAVQDIEITAIAFRLRDCGSAAHTTVDLHKLSTTGADQGSIFTNKIIIQHNENNQAGFFVNFIDNTSNDLVQGSSQMPTMTASNREIDAGESLRIDIETNATNAKDLIVYVYYRPR